MIDTEALRFMETIDTHSTPGGVLNAMTKVLRDYGLDLFCMNLLPGPKQHFGEVLLASKLPSEWLDLYLAKDYAPHDPSQRHSQRVSEPYEWKDAPYDVEREPQVLEVVQRAQDFRIGNGFVVPVPGPTGTVGSVWMSGRDLRLPKRNKPLLHVVGLYAFAHVRKLQEGVQQKLTLHNREREVLTWIAAGKSCVQIGEILQISDRTVEWHVQEAIKRLGAKTRVNAGVLAIRHGLIAP